MKKLFFLSLSVFFTLGVSAQNPLKLTEGNPVFVYSLPKTEFCIEVEIEKTTQKPGQFYQYSERYLATNQIITEHKTTYRLSNITIESKAIPDSRRTYQLENIKGLQYNFISVDKSGLLCGVNVPVATERTIKHIKIINKDSIFRSKALLPLNEEYLMAGSSAKLAEGVAKQIYRIRESRMTLLSGDMDKLPSDGKSFESMLKGLDKAEQELTELFIGRQTVEIQKHKIYLSPDSAFTNQVLFRISANRGLVDATDLGGAPYYISFLSDKIQVVAPDPKAKSEKTALNTILPANTKLTITDGIRTYYSNNFFVPQFGVIIPISEQIFSIPKVKISIDNQSGRLVRIEK